MRLIAAPALALLSCVAGYAFADELVSVCYNYGCAEEQWVSFSEARLARLREMLAMATTPERERALLAPVIGQLYAWAGGQSPIKADRGGNYADEGVVGAMDCIDHSTTTTRLLRLLEARGWLRFHGVLEPARRTRFLIFQHLSAAIEELPPRWLQPLSGTEPDGKPDAPPLTGPLPLFAVDSWFVDNGQPAIVLPLEEWLKGGGPHV